jgi:hypothetical protein
MNVRLLYISVDGLRYSLCGQVTVIVNPLPLLYTLTDQELHLATETEQDRTRLPLLQ